MGFAVENNPAEIDEKRILKLLKIAIKTVNFNSAHIKKK